MQEHVGHAVIGNDESISLGNIEPFDPAGNLDELKGGRAVLIDGCVKIDVQMSMRRLQIVGAQRTSSHNTQTTHACITSQASLNARINDSIAVEDSIRRCTQKQNLNETVDDLRSAAHLSGFVSRAQN